MTTPSSIFKLEYCDEINVFDLSYVVYIVFKKPPSVSRAWLDVKLGDTVGSNLFIYQNTLQDPDSDLLQDKFMDLYTSWKNYQKRSQIEEVVLIEEDE